MTIHEVPVFPVLELFLPMIWQARRDATALLLPFDCAIFSPQYGVYGPYDRRPQFGQYHAA
jgi:hypothetical protein